MSFWTGGGGRAFWEPLMLTCKDKPFVGVLWGHGHVICRGGVQPVRSTHCGQSLSVSAVCLSV